MRRCPAGRLPKRNAVDHVRGIACCFRAGEAAVRENGQEYHSGRRERRGQTCKVANQIVVALTIEAVGEALLFASRAGADPAKVRQALMGELATSRILELTASA